MRIPILWHEREDAGSPGDGGTRGGDQLDRAAGRRKRRGEGPEWCEAIHEKSRRAAGPFIKINSAAIPENLLESELFGYEKGAFTGASGEQAGKIRTG